MKRYLTILALTLAMTGCTAMGITAPNLALDCSGQASAINTASAQVAKLSAAERKAIDGDIEVGQPYCPKPLPDGKPAPLPANTDVTAASKQLQAGTAHILAILAVSQLRK